MAWVKTGNTMVMQKHSQSAKEKNLSFLNRTQRETDFLLGRILFSSALEIAFTERRRMLCRDRRAKKRSKQMPVTNTAVRKYAKADFGEAVPVSE